MPSNARNIPRFCSYFVCGLATCRANTSSRRKHSAAYLEPVPGTRELSSVTNFFALFAQTVLHRLRFCIASLLDFLPFARHITSPQTISVLFKNRKKRDSFLPRNVFILLMSLFFCCDISFIHQSLCTENSSTCSTS